jgi:two-component system, chemotaxis family, protein-glutamate methylesterase/glutaminase
LGNKHPADRAFAATTPAGYWAAGRFGPHATPKSTFALDDPPTMTTKIRVLVVDDSALARGLLAAIIDRQDDMVCVGAAADALIAREMIRELDPDVITLDVEMPRMDGIEFLSRLMRLRPTPVLMVSALTQRGAELSLRALELGAVDFVAKPQIGVGDGLALLADELGAKIRIAARARLQRGGAPAQAAVPAALGGVGSETVIFIGASTGGTEATRQLLQQLPADAPALMITQHMPSGFTRGYASRLDSLCRMAVKEARDGERVLRGHAYIAPGGRHLGIERSGTHYVARVIDGDPVNRHKPSVEVLFDSAAREVGAQALGVMLTGMGADGAAAMRRMRDAGSWNVAQDEASCVVFGMPREAIAAGAVHEVLPLPAIAPRLLSRLRGGAVPAVARQARDRRFAGA